MQDKIRKVTFEKRLPGNELAKEVQGRDKLLEDILEVKDFVTRKEERDIVFEEIQVEMDNKGKLLRAEKVDPKKRNFSCRGGLCFLATPPENPSNQRSIYVQRLEDFEEENLLN
jgi:hypothetical protein